ncbi:MAG: hypothetical protein EA379_04160 [Phycisphaerales bacterium]|nr:MAG: hypothetical protein EA379_04160 [Phycisphaerales bacterium]
MTHDSPHDSTPADRGVFAGFPARSGSPASVGAPALRLVGADACTADNVSSRPDPEATRAARWRIRRENELAAALANMPHDDARRLFAVRVAETLDGGRSAILRPERRDRLLRIAHMLGVRPFDANLVIAIVQDGARRGAIATGDAPRPADAVVRPAQRQDTERAGAEGRRTRDPAFLQAIGALALGVLLLALLIRWIGA